MPWILSTLKFQEKYNLTQMCEERGRPILIGRERDCDIIVPEKYIHVSKQQVRIGLTEEGLPALTDLDSTNGTWVNDIKVRQETPLHTGDSIWLSNEYLIRIGRRD